MSASDCAALLPILQKRGTAIADRWYTAVARTSFSPHGAANVRVELRALTDQAISVLLSEPFTHSPAQAIGAALSRLHYRHPAALAATIDVLGQQLVIGLSAR